MRVLLPTMAPFPSFEAPAIQTAHMAQALAEQGHDVLALHPVPGPEDPGTALRSILGADPAFRVRVLARRIHRGQSLPRSLRTARVAREVRPDLVYSRDLRACLLPARAGIPTVYEAHSFAPFERPLDRAIVRSLVRSPGYRGVVAISAALAADLVAATPVVADEVLVAHDAVREVADGPLPPGQGDRPLRVGYTGSLFAGRGIELLLEVAARADWLELHLAGGPAAAAEALAAAPHPGRVVVHGPLPPDRARELQRSCDVLVAPFRCRVGTDSGVDTARWMSPMKIFEYLASGRPVVASDLPVLREVMRPDVDALLVPPDDADALHAALLRLRDDPGLRIRLAAGALARVRAEFTWATRAERVLARFGG